MKKKTKLSPLRICARRSELGVRDVLREFNWAHKSNLHVPAVERVQVETTDNVILKHAAIDFNRL